jgi:hypothetical protein
MNNQELLFNLLKKLASGEMIFSGQDEKGSNEFLLKDTVSGKKIIIGRLYDRLWRFEQNVVDNLEKFDRE